MRATFENQHNTHIAHEEDDMLPICERRFDDMHNARYVIQARDVTLSIFARTKGLILVCDQSTKVQRWRCASLDVQSKEWAPCMLVHSCTATYPMFRAILRAFETGSLQKQLSATT